MAKIARDATGARKLSHAVVAAGGNMAEAGRKLGMTRQSVRNQVKNNPLVKSAMTVALERAGISDTRLAKKLDEQLDAMRTVAGNEDSGPITTEDNQARLKAVELCLKIKGHIKTSGDVVVDNSKKVVQLFSDMKDETINSLDTASLINELSGRISRQRAS